jgi:hypothetical protein
VAEEHGVTGSVEEEAQGYTGKRILESVQAVGCVICKGKRGEINKGKRTKMKEMKQTRQNGKMKGSRGRV